MFLRNSPLLCVNFCGLLFLFTKFNFTKKLFHNTHTILHIFRALVGVLVVLVLMLDVYLRIKLMHQLQAALLHSATKVSEGEGKEWR